MIEEHDVSRLDLLEIAETHAGWREDVDGIEGELTRRRLVCPQVNDNDKIAEWTKRGRDAVREEAAA